MCGRKRCASIYTAWPPGGSTIGTPASRSSPARSSICLQEADETFITQVSKLAASVASDTVHTACAVIAFAAPYAEAAKCSASMPAPLVRMQAHISSSSITRHPAHAGAPTWSVPSTRSDSPMPVLLVRLICDLQQAPGHSHQVTTCKATVPAHT